MDCPSSTDLQRLASGDLSSPVQRDIEQHVEECTACESHLRQIRSENAFLDQVRPALQKSHEDEANEVNEADDATNTLKRPPGDRGFSSKYPRIEGYRIIEDIGEGGMGVVYLAEQTRPVRRRVALKLIKLGMDTREVIARFESERQALALMNHPNVAAVYDAGATKQGRPFFVMEYVPGEPITTYCDKHQLALPERLNLFMQVCHAIQHAHQKGIIHRDIKPSNVLVMYQDGTPIPKVIDFGVAKATNQRLTEKTLFTEQVLLIGTPSYMSPEQAEMTSLDIDTRTDVYSLGVLLYELLTGTLPFDPKSLRGAGFLAIQRIIRELDPSRPSTKLSDLLADDDESSAKAAGRRRLDPQTLVRRLRGDLDWVTMKALEKDRTRRYDSASDFAADIQRHINDEPVIASPPSAKYKLQKFVRRNRGGVIAASLVFLALVVGLAGTTSMYLISEHQRRRADEAVVVAEAAVLSEKDAVQAERLAKREAIESADIATEAAKYADVQRDIANEQRELGSV